MIGEGENQVKWVTFIDWLIDLFIYLFIIIINSTFPYRNLVIPHFHKIYKKQCFHISRQKVTTNFYFQKIFIFEKVVFSFLQVIIDFEGCSFFFLSFFLPFSWLSLDHNSSIFFFLFNFFISVEWSFIGFSWCLYTHCQT